MPLLKCFLCSQHNSQPYPLPLLMSSTRCLHWHCLLTKCFFTLQCEPAQSQGDAQQWSGKHSVEEFSGIYILSWVLNCGATQRMCIQLREVQTRLFQRIVYNAHNLILQSYEEPIWREGTWILILVSQVTSAKLLNFSLIWYPCLPIITLLTSCGCLWLEIIKRGKTIWKVPGMYWGLRRSSLSLAVIIIIAVIILTLQIEEYDIYFGSVWFLLNQISVLWFIIYTEERIRIIYQLITKMILLLEKILTEFKVFRKVYKTCYNSFFFTASQAFERFIRVKIVLL